MNSDMGVGLVAGAAPAVEAPRRARARAAVEGGGEGACASSRGARAWIDGRREEGDGMEAATARRANILATQGEEAGFEDAAARARQRQAALARGAYRRGGVEVGTAGRPATRGNVGCGAPSAPCTGRGTACGRRKRGRHGSGSGPSCSLPGAGSERAWPRQRRRRAFFDRLEEGRAPAGRVRSRWHSKEWVTLSVGAMRNAAQQDVAASADMASRAAMEGGMGSAGKRGAA